MTLTRENAIPDVGFKISQRAVRERFDELMREFKSKEANEKRASGITTKYDEIDQALLDIKERMEDAEQTMNCIKEKEQRSCGSRRNAEESDRAIKGNQKKGRK